MSKIFDLIEKERKRQEGEICLIASENYVSKDIMKAVGSILTNKYAEGYPEHRYYGGCRYIDEIELLINVKNCLNVIGQMFNLIAVVKQIKPFI